MITKFLMFDFATKFAYENESIPKPEKFEITDDIYKQFTDFVKSNDFEYESQSTQILLSARHRCRLSVSPAQRTSMGRANRRCCTDKNRCSRRECTPATLKLARHESEISAHWKSRTDQYPCIALFVESCELEYCIVCLDEHYRKTGRQQNNKKGPAGESAGPFIDRPGRWALPRCF